jgi:glyoxylate carboligase
MAKLSGGRAVVEVLRAEGVKFVFGMPGGHTIGIYDALYGQQEITHVLVRHEQHAASMAAGYAQLTGEPGICCVTAGPGATNLVTSIAEAFVGALPIVIIAGRGATRNAHRGASQEIDQVRIFGPITKWAIRVDRPDLIAEEPSAGLQCRPLGEAWSTFRRIFSRPISSSPITTRLESPRGLVAMPFRSRLPPPHCGRQSGL